MAKNNPKLDMPEIDTTPVEEKKGSKKPIGKKSSAKKHKDFGKFFRDIISELKKVEWAPMKKTKSNGGVLAQTGNVLVVVLFFGIVITAMDLGFTELLKLLLQAAA
ncbi:MAG: preprotein translocase subunit SecE [Clostridia bacterium]